MEATKQNLAKILALVQQLEFMPGFPRSVEGMEGYARAICRIVQDQPHCGISVKTPDGKTALETAQELIRVVADEYETLPMPVELCDRYKRAPLAYRPAEEGPVPEDFVRAKRHEVLNNTQEKAS